MKSNINLSSNYIKNNSKKEISLLKKKSLNQKTKFGKFNREYEFGRCGSYKNIIQKCENRGLNKFIQIIDKKLHENKNFF